jgi:hypothetical protein
VLGRQQVARREYLQELLLYREQREIIIDGRGQLNEQAKQETSKSNKKSDTTTSSVNALATVPASTFIDLDRILNVAECAHTLNTGASALVDESDPARTRFSLRCVLISFILNCLCEFFISRCVEKLQSRGFIFGQFFGRRVRAGRAIRAALNYSDYRRSLSTTM